MRLLFILAALLSSAVAASQEMTICIEVRPLPPYSNPESDIDSNGRGIIVERMHQAAEATGIAIKLKRYPWLRCLKLVEEGVIDGVVGIIATPDRRQRFAFAKNDYLHRAEYPFFVHRDGAYQALRTSSSEDIIEVLGVRSRNGVGAQLGYVVNQKLSDEGLLSNFGYAPLEGLSMVSIDKLDAYVIERRIGTALVNRLDLADELVATQANLLVADWHVAFNPRFYQDNRHQVASFWRALTHLAQRDSKTSMPDESTIQPQLVE